MLLKLCNAHPLEIIRFAKVWIFSLFCSLPLFSMPMTQDILKGKKNETKEEKWMETHCMQDKAEKNNSSWQQYLLSWSLD